LRIAECKANKPDEKPASLNQSAIPNSQSAIPKITDFGLAKNLDDDSAQTKTGAIVGTPSYMAPEQTMGSRGTVGPAADIYALGAILYELLTGRPPFRGATVLETLEQVREADPVPLRQLVASCPRDLETICRTCLHKDPWRRYDSAQALVNDLQAFRTGRPIQARPVTQAERVWKWLRRHPALAACGLLVLVSGFALVVAVMRANHNRELEGANDQLQHAVGQTRQALGEAKVAQHEAEIARGVAADALQRERAFLYAHSVRLAYREWLANEVPRARKLLQECPEDLRGWEWRYLDRLCNSEELILAVHPAPVACIAFSPDGERLASACGTSEVFKGWKGLQLRIWNAKTGQVLHTLKGHTAGVAAVTFSPDGKRLASAAADKSVRVWDVDTGRVLYELTHPTGAAAVVFGPDGTWLATACRDKFVRFWDMATGKETKTLEQSAPVHALTVSADGRQLMCGEGVKIAVWDLDENRRLLTLEGHTLSVRGVALSPDGRHLLSTSAVAPKAGAPIAARTAPASEFAEIKLWNLATGKELSLPGPDVKMTSMCGAYSPDGRILVHAADRMIAVRDARTHEVLFELRGHGDEVAALSFTRDGHRLASAGAAGAVRVWNLRQPRETHDFSAMAGASDVAFSRDSKHLAIAGRAATGIGPTGLSPAAVVWEVGTDKARRVAASAVGRPANLTDIKGLMSLSRIECAVPDPSGKDEAAKWRKELEKSKE
jgi:WD40 repeat protein